MRSPLRRQLDELGGRAYAAQTAEEASAVISEAESLRKSTARFGSEWRELGGIIGTAAQIRRERLLDEGQPQSASSGTYRAAE